MSPRLILGLWVVVSFLSSSSLCCAISSPSSTPPSLPVLYSYKDILANNHRRSVGEYCNATNQLEMARLISGLMIVKSLKEVDRDLVNDGLEMCSLRDELYCLNLTTIGLGRCVSCRDLESEGEVNMNEYCRLARKISRAEPLEKATYALIVMVICYFVYVCVTLKRIFCCCCKTIRSVVVGTAFIEEEEQPLIDLFTLICGLIVACSLQPILAINQS